jgi:hypothetical protein
LVTLEALISKIASIGLVHTDLSKESAKFQARSAYTGAGISTLETERIMNHPLRGKIIFNWMLIGNAGIVTVMSSLILTLVLPETLASKLYGLLIIVVGLSGLWRVVHSDWVDRSLSKVVDKMLRKYTDRDVNDYAAVLHLTDNFKIIEAAVDHDGWMCQRTLQELNLREEGITILGVDRKGVEYFGSPSGAFKLLPDDVVTIYGKADGIESLYNRKKNFYADLEHEKFVEKEDNRKEEEKEKTSTS